MGTYLDLGEARFEAEMVGPRVEAKTVGHVEKMTSLKRRA